jgi:hypothetical protein
MRASYRQIRIRPLPSEYFFLLKDVAEKTAAELQVYAVARTLDAEALLQVSGENIALQDCFLDAEVRLEPEQGNLTP